MKTLHLTIFFSLCLLSSVAQPQTAQESEELELLRTIMTRSIDGLFYYKTIVKEQETHISDYIHQGHLQFDLCGVDVDPGSINISEGEIAYLQEKFAALKREKLAQLVPSLKDRTSRKHIRFKTVSISMPVLFREGSMALYFATGTYGAQNNLWRKNSDKWELVCSSMVWME